MIVLDPAYRRQNSCRHKHHGQAPIINCSECRVSARTLIAQHRDNTRDDTNERDKNVQTNNCQEEWRIRRDNNPSYDRFVLRHALLSSEIATCRLTPPRTASGPHAALRLFHSRNWAAMRWRAVILIQASFAARGS